MTLIHTLSDNPLTDLKLWLDEATRLALPEPNAITLASATPDGRPSARLVLCKAIETNGIHFFTNYKSRKGTELIANPWASAVFFWPTLAKQVRLEGQVTQVPRAASEEYFRSRPRGSQIGAWVSTQSREIPNYESLENNFRAKEQEFSDQEDVPCPPYWGGFLLVPTSVEFWMGLPSRLHDRVVVTRVGSGADGRWIKKQIAP